MDTITRRKFLQVFGAGAAGAVATSLTFEDIAQAAMDRPLPLGTPILVVVTLYGGNDGLNTLVPVNDPIYQSMRPGIAYSPDQVLPLAEDLYLNGAMDGLFSLWQKNQVAIVRGVGYPNPDRSHFTSMAIWQSANLAAVKTGWLGRWIPWFGMYARLLRPIGIILLVVGVWMRGGYDTEMAWRAKVEALEAKVAESEKKSREANTKLDRAVKERERAVASAVAATRGVIKQEAVKIDKECKLDPTVVPLLNDVAKDPTKAKK